MFRRPRKFPIQIRRQVCAEWKNQIQPCPLIIQLTTFKALSFCKRFRKVEISHQKPLEETYEKVINECRGGDNATRWVCPDRGSCECSNVIEPSNHSPNLD